MMPELLVFVLTFLPGFSCGVGSKERVSLFPEKVAEVPHLLEIRKTIVGVTILGEEES